MSLEGLIYPHSKEVFFREYFEEKPLLAKRNDDEFFDHLIKKSDINTLINKVGTLGSFNVFAKHPDRVIEPKEYAVLTSYENVEIKVGVNPIALYGLLESGAQVTFTSVQKVLPCIKDLYTSLRQEFLAHVQIQLLFIGKGDVTPQVVFPQHDSFILQLNGTTEVNIFPPGIVLPLSNQHYSPQSQELQVQTKFKLEQGDSVYLPRGYGYQCLSGPTIATQILFQVYTTTMTKVVHELIMEIANEEEVLRMGFGVSALKSTNERADVVSKIQEVLERKLILTKLSDVKAKLWQKIVHESEVCISDIIERGHL